MRALRAACVVLALLAPACAALPWPRAQVPPSDGSRGAGGYLDLRGVVHVHTRASHDSPGTPAELVAAARSAGLDWVAITEHTRPGELPPSEGRVEGVRLIPGFEMSFAGGSMLALGLRSVTDAVRQAARAGDAEAVLRALHASGAIGVLGHLEEVDPALIPRLREARLDGVEVVNLHAAAERNAWQLAIGQLALPAALGLRALVSVDPASIARLAQLGAPGGVVGGVDAHAKIRVLGPLGGRLDRYGDLFRVVTTHVLATDDSEAAILDAIRAGRSYLAFETLAPVDRVAFERTSGRFELSVPRDADLRLVCDGRSVATETGTAASWPVPAGAGRCHGEAWLDGDPWIITSAR